MADPGSVAEALTVVRLHPIDSVAAFRKPASGTQLGLEHTTKPTFFFAGLALKATVGTIWVGTAAYLAALAWAAATPPLAAPDDAAVVALAPDAVFDLVPLLPQATAKRATTPATANSVRLLDFILEFSCVSRSLNAR